MASQGSARQGRWRARGWLQLIFSALKHHSRHPTDMTITHRSLDTWYTSHIHPRWRLPRDLEATYEGRQVELRCTKHITAEILHGIACCFAHIRLIQRPAQAQAAQQQRRKQRQTAMRKYIAYLILKHFRIQRRQEAVQLRLTQRQGKISANTRSIQQPIRINYAETNFRNKPCIKKDDLYKNLRAWPYRDKIGLVLAQDHPYIIPST